jgi:hypothetical protein
MHATTLLSRALLLASLALVLPAPAASAHDLTVRDVEDAPYDAYDQAWTAASDAEAQGWDAVGRQYDAIFVAAGDAGDQLQATQEQLWAASLTQERAAWAAGMAAVDLAFARTYGSANAAYAKSGEVSAFSSQTLSAAGGAAADAANAANHDVLAPTLAAERDAERSVYDSQPCGSPAPLYVAASCVALVFGAIPR